LLGFEEVIMTYFIDLDFRPVTYFRPQPLEAYARSQVKGALLQAHLREQLASDQHDEVARRLCEEGVPEQKVQALINEHLWFMGGNYLANQEHAEVEVARIFIQSVTVGIRLVPFLKHPLTLRERVEMRGSVAADLHRGLF